MPTTLVWLRHDLRLSDHAPIVHAAERGAVVPVFVWDPDAEGDWAPGGAHRWWLHQSLTALDDDLQSRGSRLILRVGATLDELTKVANEAGADRVVWHQPIEPDLTHHAENVRTGLADAGIDGRSFGGRYLHDPDGIKTGSGGPYQVFTPFWRKLREQLSVPDSLPAPRLGQSSAPDAWPTSADLDDMDLTPLEQDGVEWGSGLADMWTPGESGALQRLDALIGDTMLRYAERRNVPSERGTSMLSPHLHWGEISPRQVWHAANSWVGNAAMRDAADVFLSEIGWREFAAHVLQHFPRTPSEPLKDKYRSFPWENDADGLQRWQRGQTGYPIVDAGMRQLWATGWMHNRVRMIVASFLTKDLLIPWQEGARWFWDTLVDGDLASNTLNWQWAAGCGADAQPFFRIFNPISQGEKFDARGDYVRRWVPELADVPNKWIHKPWEAPTGLFSNTGVTLGEDYPMPIVDHGRARKRALGALETMNG